MKTPFQFSEIGNHGFRCYFNFCDANRLLPVVQQSVKKRFSQGFPEREKTGVVIFLVAQHSKPEEIVVHNTRIIQKIIQKQYNISTPTCCHVAVQFDTLLEFGGAHTVWH